MGDLLEFGVVWWSRYGMHDWFIGWWDRTMNDVDRVANISVWFDNLERDSNAYNIFWWGESVTWAEYKNILSYSIIF